MSNAYASNVVIDLEFTPVPRSLWGIGLRNEIIEVGAVKIDGQGNVVDEFCRLVKPSLAAGVSGTVHWITGIGDEDLTCARPLDEVLEAFVGWLGDGRVRIVTWSPTDRLQVERECEAKGIRVDLPARWLDIQRLYPRLMGMSKRRVSLGDAADWCGIMHDRVAAHRALYDAKVTAELFQMMAAGECAAQRSAISEQLHEGASSCASSIGERCGGLAELYAALAAREASAA